jgi:phosphotransferase system HPr-like phosphotransfer protein
MAEYGNREIGIVQDALKEIYDELLDGGAVEFRKNLLRNLMQSMETKASWTTHTVAVFDAYQPLEKNFGNLNLQTMIDYAFANLEVLIEMDQLDNMRQPDQMWTGYYETSEAIQEIAEALNEGFDFEIDTNQDVYDLTREISEQLEGSNIKVQDVPMALELQIRTLDDMKYFEFGSITSAFHSTEVMRPFTVQLVEIYNQIEDLPEDLVSNLYAEIADNLGLKEGPSDYLRAYDNPNNSEAKAVKNVIKYFFEQQGRQQTGYINFSSVDNMYLDGGQMYSHIDSADSVAAYVGEIMQNNIEFFLPNSTQPVQLLNSVRPFDGASQPFPLEISGDYINEYNKIIGTTIIDNPTVSNKTVEAFADMNNLVTGEPLTIGEIAKELGLPERLHTIDLPSTPTNVVDDAMPTRNHFGIPESEFDKPIPIVEGDFVQATTLEVKGGLHARPTGKLGKIANDSPIKLFLKTPEGFKPFSVVSLWTRGGDANVIEVFIKEGDDADEVVNYLKKNEGVLFDADGFFTGTEAETSFKVKDTPTNVVDLDEVISQSDGVDNLNKSKEIMRKNPGMFRKVFNVLEKLDIGDQIITKAVAKGLPAIGLGALSGPVAIAYTAYELSILLTDAAQAYNKMQTTDEGFWENFGELSDKYSIAYKISKPVYDIILDSLNDDLTEEKDEEILFSFNR